MSAIEAKEKKHKYWIGPGHFPGLWGFARPWDTHFPADAYPTTQRSPTDFLPVSVTVRKGSKDILVRKATKVERQYFDKRHELPIRRLRHCTHLIEACGIVSEDPAGRYVFRGNKFGGSNTYDQECRRHEAFVLNQVTTRDDGRSIGRDSHRGGESSVTYEYETRRSSALCKVGPLVWFGVEVGTEDVKKIRERMRFEFTKATGRRKPQSDRIKSSRASRQFGTSPQFSSCSRYGNFSFSLSTEDFVKDVETCFRHDMDGRARGPQAVGKRRLSSAAEGCPDAKRKKSHHRGKGSSNNNRVMCFHCGGTLFYQREVTYVLLVTPRDKCDEFERLGLPCFGANKTLLGKQRTAQEMAHDPPDVGIPGGPIAFSEHSHGEGHSKSEEHAKMLLKSTAEEVEFLLKKPKNPNKPKFWRSQYWESVVFAVATKRLTTRSASLKLVDHEVNCCQPSMYLPQDKLSSHGMRMNCHKGGYKLAEDAREAIRASRVPGLQPLTESESNEDDEDDDEDDSSDNEGRDENDDEDVWASTISE